VFFDPQGASFPPVPAKIGKQDAADAAGRILEVVSDFPLAGDAHRSAYLAAVLTPSARFAFTGPAPLFLFDANVRGAGKTLLAQTVAHIVTGRLMPVMGYAESDELAKRITSLALGGARMILLDNVVGQFGNDALDRVLTSTRWQDRILGRSEAVDLPLLATWYATANNALVAADTIRRIVPVRLDVLAEHPEDRSGFKYPDLLAWVRSNRPRLLIDALTILAGYIRAGKPAVNLRAVGSFEGWAALVRQAIVWAGLPDPCGTMLELRENADAVEESLGGFIAAWNGLFSPGEAVTVAELIERCYPIGGIPVDSATLAMRVAVEQLCGVPANHHPTPKQLGNKLKLFRRRVIGGWFLDSHRKTAGMAWVITSAKQTSSDTPCQGISVSDASNVSVSAPPRARKVDDEVSGGSACDEIIGGDRAETDTFSTSDTFDPTNEPASSGTDSDGDWGWL
jgi:hypothetical protein